MDAGESCSGLDRPVNTGSVPSKSLIGGSGVIGSQTSESQLVGVDGQAVNRVEQSHVVALTDGMNSGAPVGPVGHVTEKRKRGRPPKGSTPNPRPPPPKRIREQEEEEDVCFVCFDGGHLVLCDRKGCPKAYHTTCIRREESFFQSRWNCGWHICSVCFKNAQYKCYTCTYSLCKKCNKDTEYFCVRENFGFCAACTKTIMLVENEDSENKEKVDFDDRSSWEYLFKVYWMMLKEKLSLTMGEVKQARNHARGVVIADINPHQPLQISAENGTVPNVPKAEEHSEVKIVNEQLQLPAQYSLGTENPSFDKSSTMDGSADWASKEVLEFVAQIKNGDTAVLSHFDVQALLMEYIKTNNLCDPLRKSQIICDARLEKLFGKPCVGHIEMLKLLEHHFPNKEDTLKQSLIPGGNHVCADQHNSAVVNQTRRLKSRSRREGRTPQINMSDYAAIDVHNISLIFLRRSMLENLIVDVEKFHDKVIGSIVRIKVSTNDQKHDMFRLVQVVGTGKGSEPYKLGDKTTDIMVDVLNLNKKETMSVVEISDQEFSEDECKRLRQSIKFGLVKQLTVGEIQRKAITLQAEKLDDWLAAEISRLNQLQNQAIEKGRKKELREYTEKLQILKTPGERQRRLCLYPEVHADPTMHPDYESENDAAGEDELSRLRFSSFNVNGNQSIYPKRGETCAVKDDEPISSQQLQEKSNGCRSSTCVQQENHVTAGVSSTVPRSDSVPAGVSSTVPRSDSVPAGVSSTVPRSDSVPAGVSSTVPRSDSVPAGVSSTVPRSDSVPAGVSSTLPRSDSVAVGVSSTLPRSDSVPAATIAVPTVNPPSIDTSETENIWSYRDPSGKIQGPFSLAQLRKWSTTGYFPADLTVWKGNEQDRHSVLLTDALTGKIHNLSESREVGNAVDNTVQVIGNGTASTTRHDGVLHSTDSTIQVNSVHEFDKPETRSLNNAYQPSQQSQRSVPLNLDLNDQGSNTASVTNPCKPSEQKDDSNLMNLPSSAPNTDIRSLEHRSSEHKESTMEIRPTEVQGSLSIDIHGKATVIPDQPYQIPDPMDQDLQKPSSNLTVQGDLGIPACKPTDEGQGQQIAVNEQPLPSKIPSEDLGWDNASGHVLGGGKMQEIAIDWAAEPGNLVTAPNLNQQPAANMPNWLSMNEPIEFSTLGEESVSDLLAEYDAMETQSGLGSPTSAARCVDDMMDRNDCFSSIEDMSPARDAAKSDALSSTADIPFPSLAAVMDDLFGTPDADAFDPLKMSGTHSTTSSEGETKSADATTTIASPWEAGSDINPSVPCTMMSQVMVSANNMDAASWANNVQGSMNMNCGGPPPQNFVNIGWGLQNPGAPTWMDPNFNAVGGYNGNVVGWNNNQQQSRYGGDRFGVSRDWPFQGGEMGFGRGGSRPTWGGNGGGGGYSRQRVCKFYENGHCRKGASCDYLHPQS